MVRRGNFHSVRVGTRRPAMMTSQMMSFASSVPAIFIDAFPWRVTSAARRGHSRGCTPAFDVRTVPPASWAFRGPSNSWAQPLARDGSQPVSARLSRNRPRARAYGRDVDACFDEIGIAVCGHCGSSGRSSRWPQRALPASHGSARAAPALARRARQ